jgi:hypothetical protein
MTEDEIRKLLGGYSTNALSPDERRMLFAAALEDQELFNALQDEDSLRELLAEPVSRDQVRRALETPHKDARRAGFWSRRWLLGVAIPAVAAVVVIVVMNRANAPRLIAPPAQVASSQISPQQPPAPPENEPAAKEQSRAEALDRGARAMPLLAPQAPAPAQFESPRTARASLRANAPPPIPDAIRQQFAQGFAGTPFYQGPLVQYSLVRSGPAGDAVRVEVSTGIAGYLALYQVDPAGNSKRVYPADDPAARVSPDVTIQIPANPIRVSGAQRLRLVVVPASEPVAPSASLGQVAGQGGVSGGAVNGAALGTGNAPLPAQPTPMVVDIPLAPN